MTGKNAEEQPIDFHRLSLTLGVEDKVVLVSFLDLFLEEFPKLSADLKSALETRDPKATHHAAHAAKGAAANAAASALTSLLKFIQDNAHQENWVKLELVFDEISQEHERIIKFRKALTS